MCVATQEGESVCTSQNSCTHAAVHDISSVCVCMSVKEYAHLYRPIHGRLPVSLQLPASSSGKCIVF